MILSMITDGLGRMKSGTLSSPDSTAPTAAKMTTKMPSTGPLLTTHAPHAGRSSPAPQSLPRSAMNASSRGGDRPPRAAGFDRVVPSTYCR